jgi:hypothetical protein
VDKRSLSTQLRVIGCGLAIVIGVPPLQAQPASQPGRLTTAELAKRASGSVVTITTSNGQGSGVILDRNGTIVTNLHVVRGETSVSVKLANGDIYDDVTVVDVDVRKDLVILKIKAFGLTTVPLGNSDQVSVGDRVVLIGSPQGLDRTVSDGLISALRDTGLGLRLIQTDAAASPGSSGGGLFNDVGQLIGILSSKLSSGENLNFAIPVNYIRGLLVGPGRSMTLAAFAAAYPATRPSDAAPAVREPASSGSAAKDLAMLALLLEGTGLRHEKRTDNAWVIALEGEHAKKVEVYVLLAADIVIVRCLVTTEERSSSELKRLLHKSFEMNFAKIGIEKEHNLVVLTEAQLRLLDAKGLKQIIEAVGSGADDVVGMLVGQAPEAVTLPRQPASTAAGKVSLLQGHAAVRYNPVEWKPDKSDDESTYQFHRTSGDLYMKIVTERIAIPLEKLSEIVLAQLQGTDPAARVTRRGWHNVGGKRLPFMEVELTVSGIAVTFYYHLYSDPKGTIQLIAWTGRSLIVESRSAIERFVAGFEVASP